MNTHNDKHAGDAATPATAATTTTTAAAPHGARRWLIAATLVVAAAAGSSFASGGPGLPGHFHHAAHVPADPAALAIHVDKMIEQFAADASPDQKARLAAIARPAMAELGPMHAQLGQAHARAHALLMAPVVDRAALEQLRVEQLQRMDVQSRRILAAVEDAADVLTPEQRARFAEQLHAHVR
jgi:protein CpxP